MTFSKKTAKNLQVVLSVAAVASSLGSTASALAGPNLSSLINLSNSAQATVNNTFGGSFSVNGVLASAITPFADGGRALINTAVATLSAAGLGLNPLLGDAAGTFVQVAAKVNPSTTLTGIVMNAAGLAAASLQSLTAVQTVAASVTNTVFGVSNIQATSSFTNQTTTSLTAF